MMTIINPILKIFYSDILMLKSKLQPNFILINGEWYEFSIFYGKLKSADGNHIEKVQNRFWKNRYFSFFGYLYF